METKSHIIREDILTVCMQTDEVPKGIPVLFIELEKKTGGLDGRYIYGVTACVGDKLIYRACIKEDGNYAEKFGLPYYSIPKGEYICATLHNWHEHLAELPGIFDHLLSLPETKNASICLEDYVSPTEMLLMVQHK